MWSDNILYIIDHFEHTPTFAVFQKQGTTVADIQAWQGNFICMARFSNKAIQNTLYQSKSLGLNMQHFLSYSLVLLKLPM